DQWVDVADTKSERWARIRMPYSASGALHETLYKADAIYLALKTRDLTARYRIVPGVLSSPFPLSAFPVDFESLVNDLQNKRVESPITRIRLETESPGDYKEPSLELLEETGSGLTFAD